MRTTFKIAAALILATATSACTTETASRATPFELPFLEQDAAESTMVSPDFRVAKINVVVPDTLTVSEENTIKPRADIVWRGDAYGNRYEQVKAVLEEGLNAGVKGLHGSRDVILDVQLVRFHAQTQHVRYSALPSKHEIEFMLTVRDANTGEVIVPSHMVNATFDALGGKDAVAADLAGITQKMRIDEHLSSVIFAELLKPIPA